MLKCLKAALLTGMFLAFASEQIRAATKAVETLESAALRVELSTSPYSFRVIERATDAVLVSRSDTAFTENHYRATSSTSRRLTPERTTI